MFKFSAVGGQTPSLSAANRRVGNRIREENVMKRRRNRIE